MASPAMTGPIPKLTVQVVKIRLAAEGMRVELQVASPEPAVGLFTPAGACPRRLRRHFVISCAAPGQNPPAVRFGSSRVLGRGLGRAAARSVPWCRPGNGDDDWGAAARRRARPEKTCRVRQGKAAWRSLASLGIVPHAQGWQSRTGGKVRETADQLPVL